MSKDVFERDRKFYQEHGMGGRMGFGRKPAIIVIDLQLGFTDATCPLGGDLDRVVASCKDLIAAAHQKQIPVFCSMATTASCRKSASETERKRPTSRIFSTSARNTAT